MNLALAKNETGRAVSDSFAVARDRLPGTGSVAEARNAAFEAYDSVGLPHRRIEDWKYTDLRALMREVLPLAPAPDAAALKRFILRAPTPRPAGRRTPRTAAPGAIMRCALERVEGGDA